MTNLIWAQFTGTRMYRAYDGEKIVAVAVRVAPSPGAPWSWALLAGDSSEHRAPTIEAAQERAEAAYAIAAHVRSHVNP